VARKLAAIGLDAAWRRAGCCPGARNGNESVSVLADEISQPFWRALALADAGRLSRPTPMAQPAPEREG